MEKRLVFSLPSKIIGKAISVTCDFLAFTNESRNTRFSEQR
jgi:hypothetical protein